MRVLLTGADGFIGSHLAEAIQRAGHTLTSVVYRRPAQAQEVRVDLTQKGALAALPHECDVVVHAAGAVDPRLGRARTFAVNLGATRRLLRWARQARVQHFVHISSVAVYGPLLLGEQRSENTLRLGRKVGLPYMRSKALAELAIERSGVPYSLLRPPAVVGAGDTVVTPGFLRALSGPGLPILPHANYGRRVSLVTADGLAQRVLTLLSRGPLNGAVHAIDVDLTLEQLAQLYARNLGVPCTFTCSSWREAFLRKEDAGFAWLAASSGFGQHYTRTRQDQLLGAPPPVCLEAAVRAGLSSLQGIKETLF